MTLIIMMIYWWWEGSKRYKLPPERMGSKCYSLEGWKEFLASFQLTQYSESFFSGLFIIWNSPLSIMHSSIKSMLIIPGMWERFLNIVRLFLNSSSLALTKTVFFQLWSQIWLEICSLITQDINVFSQLRIQMIFLLPGSEVGTKSFLCYSSRRSLTVSGCDTVVGTDWTQCWWLWRVSCDRAP